MLASKATTFLQYRPKNSQQQQH